MALRVLHCVKCYHEWASKKERPKFCPKCKSEYWDLPEKTEVFMNSTVNCPVCTKEFNSYLNLARHMVLSDRPSGEHQLWLQDFLNKRFEEYAFGKDKAIALRLKAYFEKNKFGRR